jgi:hypothetical protein
MVKRPMRRVDVKQKERTVVTARATVRANIRYAFGNWQRFADGGYENGRVWFGRGSPFRVAVKV